MVSIASLISSLMQHDVHFVNDAPTVLICLEWVTMSIYYIQFIVATYSVYLLSRMLLLFELSLLV